MLGFENGGWGEGRGWGLGVEKWFRGENRVRRRRWEEGLVMKRLSIV